MANVDAAFGLRPVRYLNGAPYNGETTAFVCLAGDSTALFLGDPVIFAGSSNASAIGAYGAGTLASITAASGGTTSTQAILGVVVSVDPLIGGSISAGTDPGGRDAKIHRVASTERVINVATDPQIVYEVQSDGTTVADDIGLNSQYIMGTGSAVTGIAGGELDDSEAATTLTDMLKILSVANLAGNTLGEFNILNVLINQSQFRTGVVGL